MSLTLEQLKEKHHDDWSRQPSWAAVATARDAADTSAQHAADIKAVQATLDTTTQQLDECRKLLLDAARDREDAVARVSVLEAENASLKAALLSENKKREEDVPLASSASAASSSKQQKNQNKDDDDDDDDDATRRGSRSRSTSSRQQQHPERENVVRILRDQNEAHVRHIAQLTTELAQLRDLHEQQQQDASSAASSSSSSGTVASILSRLVDAGRSDTENENTSLRAELAVEREARLIAERIAARVIASSSSSASSCADPDSAKESKERDAQQQQQQQSTKNDDDDDDDDDADADADDNGGDENARNSEHDGEMAPQRRRRAAEQHHHHHQVVDEKQLEKDRQHFSPSSSPSSSSMAAIPPSTSEMIRFWAYGKTELHNLRGQLEAARKAEAAATLRADAADALTRSRSELVHNMQTLAAELEASRDECGRLRCDLVGLERESGELAAHLSAALASQMSQEEVARCAQALKEAAAKAATIAALTAPEASVAKDAIKRNQALVHELTVMTKRRDELREEISMKQRTLDHLSTNIWLRSMSGAELQRAKLAALTATGQPLALGRATAAAAAASSSSSSSVVGKTPVRNSSATGGGGGATSSSTSDQALRQKILDMQGAVSERDAVILDLRRALAAAAGVSSSDQQQQQLPADAAGGEENNKWDSAAVATSLRQDASITALKASLATAQRQIGRHEDVNGKTLAALAEVSALTRELLSLVDSLLSSHSLFATKEDSVDHDGEVTAVAAANTGVGQRNPDQQEDGANDGSAVSGAHLLSTEELSVIRSVLSALEQHQSFAEGRIGLLEAFKGIAGAAQQTQACTALEARAAELSQAREHISSLLSRLETLQKGAAEQATWNAAVESAVQDMGVQLAEKERGMEDSMSLFVDMALHRIDIAAKEQVAAGVKPQAPPVAAVSASNASSSAAVNSAKIAVKKAEGALVAPTPSFASSTTLGATASNTTSNEQPAAASAAAAETGSSS